MKRNFKDTIESLVTPCIPFAFNSKKLTKTWDEKGGHNNNRGFVNGIATAGFIAIPFFYLVASLIGGSLNPTKWPEIRDQRNLEQQIQIQDSYRKEFQELDKNKDYVVDSTEFIYRK